MTRPALIHACPQWAPPLVDLYASQESWRRYFAGERRIVRNRRRARLLKRRGVPIWYVHRDRVWVWFVELTAAEHTAREERTEEESN